MNRSPLPIFRNIWIWKHFVSPSGRIPLQERKVLGCKPDGISFTSYIRVPSNLPKFIQFFLPIKKRESVSELMAIFHLCSISGCKYSEVLYLLFHLDSIFSWVYDVEVRSYFCLLFSSFPPMNGDILLYVGQYTLFRENRKFTGFFWYLTANSIDERYYVFHYRVCTLQELQNCLSSVLYVFGY